MPTYEYACRQCGEHLDVVQSFTDDALTTCPSCAGSLRKVFGTIGISFKGSGFYKNDSRTSSNGAKKSEKSEKSEKEPAAKAESSTTSGEGKSSEGSGGSNGGAGGKSESAKSDAPKSAAPKAAS